MVQAAIKAMNSGFEKEYSPIPENAAAYAKIYNDYVKLGSFTETQLFAEKE